MSDAFRARLGALSAQQLQLLALDLRARLDRVQDQRHEPIAIVGMACRFPGANNPDEFWELIAAGKGAVREVPLERWNASEYYDPDPDAKGRMSSRWGGFIDNIDKFDAEFFGIAPREAHALDPQHRLLLEVAWEALENAAISPDSLRESRTGVFVGIGASDYFQLCVERGYEAIDAYLASGASPSVASGRVSYVLGLEGPAYSIDTACSSSMMAIHAAVRSLRAGESRMTIAGGVSALLWPGGTIAVSRGRMMSSDGRCKTFDASGDGFVRGEGCGIVVLKRLSDAIADQDRILALVRGSAANHDGRSNGLTAPNGRAQVAVITAALADANVKPADVSYIEAHGTGTSLGDPIEVHALGQVLTAERAANDPFYIGSVKTNVGHLEATSGVAGLIKTVLMVQHRQIPAHLNFENPNPLIDWGSIPVRVPTQLMPWEPRNGVRIAGVSSFGLSGSNVHVVVEEAPAPKPRELEPSESAVQLLPLSARSEEALREVARRYDSVLADASLTLADAAFTAGAGRSHFEHRGAIIVRTREDARLQLRELAEGQSDSAALRGVASPSASPKIAFLYTGQGSQYAGMGASLYKSEPVFRQAMERCAAILDPILPSPLLGVMHADASDRRIHDAAFTQPANVALQFALTELWKSWGIVPSAVIGHSAGEYAAACIAGVISIEDVLPLVAQRASFMQRAAGHGAMLAVFATEEVVRAHLRAYPRVSIAAYNGPDSLVLSGERQDIERVAAALTSAAVEVRQLEISYASHSPLMDPVLDEYEQTVGRLALKAPQRVLISNVTGAVAGDEVAKASYWRRHLREPVRFVDGISQLLAMGTRMFVEIGPHPSLVSMARRYAAADGIEWLSSLRRDRDDAEQMVETLGALYVNGASIDWKSFAKSRGARRAALPTYPFERESYWYDRVESAPAVGETTAANRKTIAAALPNRHRLADWMYEVTWERADRSPTAGPSGTWLLVGGSDSLRASVAAQLESSNARAVNVVVPITGDSFDVAFAAAIDAAVRDGAPSRVVYLEGANATTSNDAPFTSEYDRVMRGAFALARASVSRGWNAPLWFVTQGATAASRVSAVAASGLVGLRRSLAVEYPNLQGGLLDLDRSSSVARARAIIAELSGANDEPTVAIVGGRRLVPRVVRANEQLMRDVGPVSLRSDATYVVSGALGGIGLRLLGWLAARGARHLALLVRRDAVGDQIAALDDLRAKGVDVRLIRADVSDFTQVGNALQTVRASMPPIAGVFHAAGTSDSALLERTDWARFSNGSAAKVHGGWNLHELTRDDALDHFVQFSSGSSLFGAVGLSAYASANAILDGLAHHRRAEGLPILSVNWGGWAGAGMHASVQTSVQETWTQSGLHSMPPDDALALLGHLMAIDAPAQLVAFDMDWATFVGSNERRGQLFAHFAAATTAASATPPTYAAGVVDQDVSALDTLSDPDATQRLTRFLRAQVARELGLATERVSTSRSLNSLGLDSLMAVQLRNRVEAALHISVPVSRFIEGLSVEQIAIDLLERVRRSASVGAVAPAMVPQTAPVEVGALSDDEVERMLREMLSGGQGT